LYKLSSSSFVIFSIIPLVRLSGSRIAAEQYDPKWIYTFSMFLQCCHHNLLYLPQGHGCFVSVPNMGQKWFCHLLLGLPSHYSCWSFFLLHFAPSFLFLSLGDLSFFLGKQDSGLCSVRVLTDCMANLIKKKQLKNNFHLILQIPKLFRIKPFWYRKIESKNVVRPVFWAVRNCPEPRYIGLLVPCEHTRNVITSGNWTIDSLCQSHLFPKCHSCWGYSECPSH
jgi:hypothetical protein